MQQQTGAGRPAAIAAAGTHAEPEPGLASGSNADTSGRRGRGRADELAGRASTAATAPATPVTVSVDDQRFRLAVEVLYHGARQGFFASAHRWAMFLAILLGASAAVPFGGEKLCGFLAAVVAAADIAFALTERAQLHADFRRRYLELVEELTDRGEVDRFEARWAKISGDEPPVHRVVEDMAYRNACIALGREPVPDPLPLWPRLKAHLVRG